MHSSDINDLLFIYLSWTSYIFFDVSVNISATLSSTSGVLQQSSISLPARPDVQSEDVGFCASDLSPASASILLLSLTSLPFFQLHEEEILFPPKPFMDPFPDPSVQPSPGIFPEPFPDLVTFSSAPDSADDNSLIADEVTLFVNFTYESTVTNVESGLNFLDLQYGGNCFEPNTDFVFYSGNDFSNVGQERFIVYIGEAHQQGLWADEILITLTADWWRIFDPFGEVIVNVALVGPDGVIQKEEFPVFPGALVNCDHRPVAENVISNDAATNAYYYTVTTEPMTSSIFFLEGSSEKYTKDCIKPSLGLEDSFVP